MQGLIPCKAEDPSRSGFKVRNACLGAERPVRSLNLDCVDPSRDGKDLCASAVSGRAEQHMYQDENDYTSC
jgi:hypothetical protein